MEHLKAPSHSGGKRHADAQITAAPHTTLPSPQTGVLVKDDLVRVILSFTVSSGDFRALVRACIRPAARGGYRATFIERLITETGNKAAGMVNAVLLAFFNEWCATEAQTETPAHEKVRADIRDLASSFRSIVRLAISSDSGKEIRSRFWKEGITAYNTVNSLNQTAVPIRRGSFLCLSEQAYQALTAFQAMLAGAMLRQDTHRGLSTAWAHYRQVVEHTKTIGNQLDRYYVAHGGLPTLTESGLRSGARVLRERFSAEVLEAAGLTQQVVEHAGPMEA